MNNSNKEHDYDPRDQWPASLDDVDVELTPEQAMAIGAALAKSGLVIPASLACDRCKALARAMSSKGNEQSQNNFERSQ